MSRAFPASAKQNSPSLQSSPHRLDAARSLTAREQAQREQSGTNMTGAATQDVVSLAHNDLPAAPQRPQSPAVADVAAARRTGDGWMDAGIPRVSRKEDENAAPPRNAMRPLLVVAGVVIVVVFGGLGAWSTMTPIDSAAVAPGMIAVETDRHLVQHLEGASSPRCWPSEGSMVRHGQLLMRLKTRRARGAQEEVAPRRALHPARRRGAPDGRARRPAVGHLARGAGPQVGQEGRRDPEARRRPSSDPHHRHRGPASDPAAARPQLEERDRGPPGAAEVESPPG